MVHESSVPQRLVYGHTLVVANKVLTLNLRLEKFLKKLTLKIDFDLKA